MGKTYEELMAQLSPERHKRVETRAAEFIAEEKSWRDLRHARHLTQMLMAKKLGCKQHSISRLEQRSDMLLSTLRDYIGKMGGELVLTARFPNREPVKIKGFTDIASYGVTRSARRFSRAAGIQLPRAAQKLQDAHLSPPRAKPRRGQSPASAGRDGR